MIVLTLDNLINSINILQRISSEPLKAKTAYVVAKLIKAADAEMANFNEIRFNLIDKYGEKDENGEFKTDGNNVILKKETVDDFNKELRELLNTSLTFNVNKLNLDDLESINFTPAEMIQLEPFIET